MASWRSVFLVIAVLLGTNVSGASAGTDAQVRQLLQMADYIGVDYGGAVTKGVVADETEYAEMVEFAATLARGIAGLPDSSGSQSLANDTNRLIDAVAQMQDARVVRAITAGIQAQLLRSYPVAMLPLQPPDLALGASLYAQQCATCHGPAGRGDGPAGSVLAPPPTDFHDPERAGQRSLYSLYNTISIGVANTAMRGFSDLDDHARWSLAFFVAGFHDAPADASAEAAWKAQGGQQSAARAIITTDAELRSSANGHSALVWLRAHPEVLIASETPDSALDLTQTRLQASLQHWRDGDRATAYALALSAYLDGFEPVEPTLAGVNESLMRDTERALMAYRSALQSDADAAIVLESHRRAMALLDASEQVLDGEPLAASVTFASAFVILAREGLEAILLLAAMLVFIRRMAQGEQQRRASHAIHWGWVVALLAGFATWSISNWILVISGATRELTEGVTALIAAAVLVWVALWMHGQVAAREWSGFVTGRLDGALHQQSRWWLFGLSFLAVYREVFETVLFYQALWLQIGLAGRGAMIAGVVAASGFLLLALWGILRAGAKLPIRQFFTVCAYTVLLLAVVFTGKGVVALQESGVVIQTPVGVPSIAVLGVYPTLQSLGAQVLVLVLTVTLLWRQRRSAD